MIHAESSRIASAGATVYSNSLANAALFVLNRDPSGFASDHGSGLSGCARTSLMGRALL